jgi:glucose/arabinose dehydrogenase
MSIRAILTAIACIAGILGPTSARGELVNRWSFNNAAGSAPAGTVITDSISGSNGVVVGTGATFSGTALTIPGNTTGNQSPATIAAYVDLPNGLISSKSNLTVEIWATVVTTRNWQRLFDFGRMNIAGMGSGAAPGEIKPDATTAPGTTQSSDNLMLAVNRGTTPNTQRAAGRLDGATELNVDSGATIATGTEYHFAMVIEDGAGSSGPAGSQLRWYLNGSLIATRDLNFRITSIEDVNNWLGRSQWSGDSQANISFNEVRLYNHAMSASEIVASRNAGPNPGAPVASPDSVTMHHGQKARIPVTANDAGSLFPAGVTIVSPPTYGAASPDSAGRVLYAHTSGAPASDSFTYTVSGMGGTSAAVAVTVNFATGLRIANNTLNVPSTPPPTSYQLINPYPNLVFNQPLCIRTPPGETNRLFVCEKTGLVRVIPDLAAATPTAVTFLNLPALLSSRGETLATSSENGLLGLAFHPGYATNGYFYVFYSVTVSGSLYQRVSRFTVQAGNPNAANTASEVILINQVHPASNHNGGDLHFGPDGYLYISLGDGGGANDQYNNSQRIDLSFFSAMARIDVDKRPGNLAPNPHTAVPLYSGSAAYAVPVDNPFVGATTFNGSAVNPANVRTEFYAVGLRNPWRFSFDLVTSNLWCADVGQNLYEEIDLITSGGNYGWAYREGAHNGPKAASAPANFDTLYHTPPLY